MGIYILLGIQTKLIIIEMELERQSSLTYLWEQLYYLFLWTISWEYVRSCDLDFYFNCLPVLTNGFCAVVKI